jgi:catechol-2,3-dioxygenase
VAGAQPVKVLAQPATRHGRPALRVELSPEAVAAQDYVDSDTFVVLPVDFGDGEIELDLLSNPDARHVAFRVDTLAELRERYAAAGRRGGRVRFSFDHGATLSFYVLDPEGNACELYWETGRPGSGTNRPVDLTTSEAELLERLSAGRAATDASSPLHA